MHSRSIHSWCVVLVAIDIGRVCEKTQGREKGNRCVIVDVIDRNFVMVIGPNGTYLYNNLTKNYTKITSTDDESRQKSLVEQASDLLGSQTLKVLGSDTLDGKEVTVVEYSYNVSGVIMSPKFWIWNEKGIPLKMEMKSTLYTVNMTMTMVYKNFIFAEILDSIFEVS